jgi:hypothetical protein
MYLFIYVYLREGKQEILRLVVPQVTLLRL